MSSEKEATAEVDFTFHVGPKKRVDVTIPVMVSDGGCTSLLKAGEASVKEFVSQESIPFPLEEPLVRCTEIVLQAVEESKLSQQYQTAQHETCLEQAKLWAAAFHQKTAEHASDQIGWEGAHRLAAIEEKSGRSRLFNRVVHSSHKNVERLAQFEGSLEISLSAIREGRKRAIDEAQDRQAQEMEREVMRDGSPEQLTRLVSAQIEEMDAINSLWSKKEQTETEQQQERYWSLVTSLAAAAVPSPTDPTTEECTSVAPHKPLVRVSEGSIPFPFCTGQGQLKTLYKIEATCASPIPGLCEASSGVTGSRDKLLRRERTLQALYSRDLVGLVLPVPSTGTGLSGCLEESEWGCCRAFYKAAGTTFDMHFGSVSRQLENTPKMLRAGDVCVTRHSNMLDLHTVFHLILNRFDGNHIIHHTTHQQTFFFFCKSIISIN